MARSIKCECEASFTCGYCLRNAKPYHFTPTRNRGAQTSAGIIQAQIWREETLIRAARSAAFGAKMRGDIETRALCEKGENDGIARLKELRRVLARLLQA